MSRSQSPRSRTSWIFLSVVVLLIVTAAACGAKLAADRAQANAPLPQRVERLFAAGDIAGALALASQAMGTERAETAGVLVKWAGSRTPATRADAEKVADACLIAAALDSRRNDVYPPLAETVRAFRLAAQARRGFSAWMEAFGADPTRRSNPEFESGEPLGRLADLYEAVESADRNPTDPEANVEAARQSILAGNADDAKRYAAKAREVAPGRLDVLSVLAGLNMLDTVPVETVLDFPVDIQRGVLADVRGGKAAVAGLPGEVITAYVISLADGKVEAIFERCTGLTISPCGGYAAYAVEPAAGKPCPIRVMDLKTKQSRLLFETAAPERGIKWSPDGAYIAVSSMEGLILVRPDGTNRRLVMAWNRSGSDIERTTWAWPQWVAGGAKVSAQLLGWEWLGEVRVYDLASGKVSVALSMGGGGYDIGTVTWAPDGDRMALAFRPTVNWAVAVARAGTDAADAEVVVGGEMDVDPVAWSPDGRQLIFRMGERHWLWDGSTREMSLMPGSPYFYSVWTGEGVIYYLAASEGGKRLIGVRLLD
jgi:hypothetical protein